MTNIDALYEQMKPYKDKIDTCIYRAIGASYELGRAAGYSECTSDVKAYADASIRNRMLERIDEEMGNCDNCPGFDEGVYLGLMAARQIICEEMGTPESEQVKSS